MPAALSLTAALLLQDGPNSNPILFAAIFLVLLALFAWLVISGWPETAAAPKPEEPPAAAAAAPATPGEPEAAPAPAESPEVPPAADDLKVIEGIGPKIAAVLNQAGVTTFARLSTLTPDQIREILQAADLRLADPATWPEQARLAASGDAAGLQALQDRLKAGRAE